MTLGLDLCRPKGVGTEIREDSKTNEPIQRLRARMGRFFVNLRVFIHFLSGSMAVYLAAL